MNKKYIISTIFLSLLFASPTYAGNGSSVQELMALSKYTGACGILNSMSAFQNSTKMPGGDEFIQRFWSTEAARLGKTPEQYISDCNKYISLYEKMWSASNEKQ